MRKKMTRVSWKLQSKTSLFSKLMLTVLTSWFMFDFTNWKWKGKDYTFSPAVFWSCSVLAVLLGSIWSQGTFPCGAALYCWSLKAGDWLVLLKLLYIPMQLVIHLCRGQLCLQDFSPRQGKKQLCHYAHQREQSCMQVGPTSLACHNTRKPAGPCSAGRGLRSSRGQHCWLPQLGLMGVHQSPLCRITRVALPCDQYNH